MGLLNLNNNNVVSPAVRTYKWAAGLLNKDDEKYKFADRLSYYQKNEDGEGGEEITAQLEEFAVLGIGFGVTGVRNVGGKYHSIYSTAEVNYNTKWNNVMSKIVKVMESSEDSKETLFYGPLSHAVGAKSQNIEAQVPDAKMAISLYIWNYKTEQIERILAKGSVSSVVREMLFGQNEYKGLSIDDYVWSLSGEEKRKTGSVTYFVPKFTVVKKLEEKDMEEFKPQFEEVQNYLNIREKSVADDYEEVDVAPQEEVATEAPAEEDPIDLSDLPF